MVLIEGVAGETPTVANALPLTRAGISGVADDATTSAKLWIGRSLAAGDALAYKFVPGVGLYLKNGATADGAVNATGIASGKGLAVTNYGATGTTPTFPNAAALANADAMPTTTKVGSVILLRQTAGTTTPARTAGFMYDQGNIADQSLGVIEMVFSEAANQWRYAAGYDADNPAAGRVKGVGTYLWNGTTPDRARGNTETTLLASAARTANTQTAIQTNHNHRGVTLVLNVTAASGTGGLRAILYFSDAAGTVFGTQAGATPTIVLATGAIYYSFYPGVTGLVGGVAAQSLALPRYWFVIVLHSDASSYTYSLTAEGIV